MPPKQEYKTVWEYKTEQIIYVEVKTAGGIPVLIPVKNIDRVEGRENGAEIFLKSGHAIYTYCTYEALRNSLVKPYKHKTEGETKDS